MSIQVAGRSGTSEELTRVQILKKNLVEGRKVSRWSLQRARLFTTSWKETEGQPIVIRRAYALKKVLEGIPIVIGESELIVGNTAAVPQARELYPEWGVEWLVQALNAASLDEATSEKNVTIDNVQELRELCDYWKSKCFQTAYFQLIGEENERWIRETGDKGIFCDISHLASETERLQLLPNYEKVLKKGYRGIINEAKDALQNLPPRIGDIETLQKVYFLRALIIAYEAAIQYSRRYAAEARRLARDAESKRKQELLKIAEICAWVPENPARSFHEALQALWFTFIVLFLESKPGGVVPGRFDQYMYPFYKRDVAEGRMTREEALELLECYRIISSSTRKSRSKGAHEEVSGELYYHTHTLGGQTADGKDATNELSYLILEAAMRTRTPNPNLCVRLHDKTPESFALKAMELIKTGQGFPALFNDTVIIPYFVSELGIPLEVARDYAIAGCVNPHICNMSGSHYGYVHNSAKFLEFALNDGIDPRSGKQVGLRTGTFANFRFYDDLVKAFETQEEFFMRKGADLTAAEEVLRGEIMTPLIASGLVDDCIKRSKSVHSGGARYEFPAQVATGMINVVNSLAAVKKRVFEDSSVGKQELLDALKANFAGKEKIRQLLLSAPKFGNDDDYVDNIARDLYQSWRDIAVDTGGFYGQKCTASPYSITRFFPMGRACDALPDGRLASEPLADGSVSPFRGSDTNGPTAVINSACKLNQSQLHTTLLNMKFHPSALRTSEDLKKLLMLIKTYFDYGGRHIQFNVVDRETLIDAQRHPEQHRDLVVRVAGYSAFFVELANGVQNDIIARTELQEI